MPTVKRVIADSLLAKEIAEAVAGGQDVQFKPKSSEGDFHDNDCNTRFSPDPRGGTSGYIQQCNCSKASVYSDANWETLFDPMNHSLDQEVFVYRFVNKPEPKSCVTYNSVYIDLREGVCTGIGFSDLDKALCSSGIGKVLGITETKVTPDGSVALKFYPRAVALAKHESQKRNSI